MKRLIPILAVATLSIAAVSAQAEGLYGELGYTALKLDGNVRGTGVDARPGMARGILGLELSENMAVETMLGLRARNAAIKSRGAGIGGQADVDHLVGVFAKPKLRLGEGLELYGRLGATHSRLSLGSETDSDTSVAYGLGASYRFTPQFSVNADYMNYRDRGDTALKGVTLGVGYSF